MLRFPGEEGGLEGAGVAPLKPLTDAELVKILDQITGAHSRHYPNSFFLTSLTSFSEKEQKEREFVVSELLGVSQGGLGSAAKEEF